MKIKNLKVIDLFCGAGGMSLGFENAGFNIVAAYDHWDKAIEVYSKNFNHQAYERDLSNAEIISELKGLEHDIIIGGPPCQDFSSAGKRQETSERADLTVKFAETIAALKPRYFVMENVAQVEKSKAFQLAKSILAKNNYGLSTIVLDASKTGVPQKRKRFFMIGEYGGNDGVMLEYLESDLADKSMTIRDYFGDSLGVEHYYRHPRNYNRRAVYSIDEPSPTVRGVNRPVPKGYKGHNKDSAKISENIRPLTSIERSYIQTFPEGFFDDSMAKTHLELLIGNAVPVKLAEYVANSLLNYINDSQANEVKGQLEFSLFNGEK